jgi:hypothetical protein
VTAPPFYIWYSERTRWQRTGRTAVPVTFEVAVDDPQLPLIVLTVAMEGSDVVCDRVTFVRRQGERRLPISKLRAPIKRFATEAASHAAVELEEVRPDGSFRGRRRSGTVDAFLAELPRTQRGRRLSDEDLQRVAEIYREALADRKPPTKAVERALPTSRSNAGRLVQEARRRGFLGAATPRRAGEATPKKKGGTNG